MQLNRRELLAVGGAGVAGAALASVVPFGGAVSGARRSLIDEQYLPRPFTTAFQTPPVLTPVQSVRGADGAWTDFYRVKERLTTLQILQGGRRSRAFSFNGVVPGPTIKTTRGRRIRLTVQNELPSVHPTLGYKPSTSVHLHGSASKPQYDGYASDLTPPGFYKEYHYPNFQAARTLWYHDHAAHRTSENVYSGLAAQYHIHDAVERALLPQGRFDVPLTISDVWFREDGEIGFDHSDNSGTWGDVILVNGRPWPVMQVQRRVYRFRILAASISRSWRWRLSNGAPMTIVATDGGLMPVSQTVTQFRHAPAERYEVLIDFSKIPAGQRVILQNLSNDNNRDFPDTDKVMAFDVTDEPVDKRDPTWNRIPTELAPSPVMNLTAAMQTSPKRRLRVERTAGKWTINGLTWDAVVASNFQRVIANPALNAVEVWILENSSGGWHHPLHIHLVDFRILSRNGAPPFPWELGPKDTAYVGENETIETVMRFEHQRGRYMVHCHNLPHEDHDMMVQFSVGYTAGAPDPNDPIHAAPCKYDDLPF